LDLSDILTDADLAEIEKRAEAATPGPWWLFTAGDGITEVDANGKDAIPVCKWTGFDDARRSHKEHRANAAFIAASRTDIPRLLKEIARLRGIEERAKALVADIGEYRVSLTEGYTDEYARMCDWEARLDGFLEGEGKVSEPDTCHEEGE
jgi:hypothetical protein